jgi:hypothetical protein
VVWHLRRQRRRRSMLDSKLLAVVWSRWTTLLHFDAVYNNYCLNVTIIVFFLFRGAERFSTFLFFTIFVFFPFSKSIEINTVIKQFVAI